MVHRLHDVWRKKWLADRVRTLSPIPNSVARLGTARFCSGAPPGTELVSGTGGADNTSAPPGPPVCRRKPVRGRRPSPAVALEEPSMRKIVPAAALLAVTAGLLLARAEDKPQRTEAEKK